MSNISKVISPELEQEVRSSFSGIILTSKQFYNCIDYTVAVGRHIQETGSFDRPLEHIAHMISCTESIKADRAKSILRNFFKILTGQTFNQFREQLLGAEAKLFDRDKNAALDELSQALDVLQEVAIEVEEGDKINFYRSYTDKAGLFAEKLGITCFGAKKLIKEAHKRQSDLTLEEFGNDLDERFYHPKIDAEIRANRRSRGGRRSYGKRFG